MQPPEAAAAALAIGAHLMPLISGVDVVAAFSATAGEVDLTPFFLEILTRGTTLCFPRVEGPGELVFVPVRDLSELQPGAFGISEPTGEPIDLTAIGLFLVPALGFDRRGTRLGFGGGYYDRVLSQVGDVEDKVPLLLGIGYSCQVLDTFLPTDDWDVPVDSVITESGVVRIA